MKNNQFLYFLLLFLIVLSGCDSGYSNIEKAQIEIKNIEELLFRDQIMDIYLCAYFAHKSGYDQDKSALDLKSDKLLTLRVCEDRTAIKIMLCRNQLEEDKLTSQIDKICYSSDRNSHIEELTLEISCRNKRMDYMEKYLEPLENSRRNEYNSIMELEEASVKDFYREKYAEECGYL